MHPKYICGRGSALNPIGGAYCTPPDPLAAGVRTRHPSPTTPFPLSLSAFGLEFRPFRPHEYPQRKFLSMPMGSVSSHKCFKGFRFKEMIEKHWVNMTQDSASILNTVEHDGLVQPTADLSIVNKRLIFIPLQCTHSSWMTWIFIPL